MFDRLVRNWAVRRQRAEMSQFADFLSAMDGKEIGMVVACATHVRHQLENEGTMLLFPQLEIQKDPMVTARLSRMVEIMQKEKRPRDAAAVMVWVHTLRAMSCLELRMLGRKIWKELSRGFPHVEWAADVVEEMVGKPCNVGGYEQFPGGLTPEPTK